MDALWLWTTYGRRFPSSFPSSFYKSSVYPDKTQRRKSKAGFLSNNIRINEDVSSIQDKTSQGHLRWMPNGAGRHMGGDFPLLFPPHLFTSLSHYCNAFQQSNSNDLQQPLILCNNTIIKEEVSSIQDETSQGHLGWMPHGSGRHMGGDNRRH
jgi:hypothetical protein